MVAVRRIGADATASTLDRIVAWRVTAPRYIRCDNGPEVAANPLRDLVPVLQHGQQLHRARCAVGEPVCRIVQRPAARRVLAVEYFDSLLEAQVLIEGWRIEYSTSRPHRSLGWLTLAAYVERWEAPQHARLS